MESIGIDINSTESPDRILAEKMFNAGIFNYDDTYMWYQEGSLKKKVLERKQKRIYIHRKTESARNVTGEYIDCYCRFFGCDADYLFGYIDTPSRANTDICKATGLSEKSVQVFLDRKRANELEEILMREIIDKNIRNREDLDSYDKKLIDNEKAVEHTPYHLIPCINYLLEYNYQHKESDNIIDLIYEYICPSEKSGFSLGDQEGQIIRRDQEIVFEGKFYKVADLLEQSQLNAIYDKLSEMKRDVRGKES